MSQRNKKIFLSRGNILMASKHIRGSTSSASREMQTETTIKYHSTPIRMGKIKNRDHTKCWRWCEETGLLVHFWRENVSIILESNLAVFQKVTYWIILLIEHSWNEKITEMDTRLWLLGIIMRVRMRLGDKWSLSIERQHERFSCWWKCSVSRLYWCRCCGCDIDCSLQDITIGANWVKGTLELCIISYNWM